MPDRHGLDILKKLRAENCPVPVFATSANGDIATAVEAIRNGAHDFIEKPLRSGDVLDRVEAAIEELSQASSDALPDISLHLPGCAPFTRREREVLARIAIGDTNKEAARTLGLSSRTIEGYRAKIMKKVGARNAAELLRRVLSQAHAAPERCIGGSFAMRKLPARFATAKIPFAPWRPIGRKRFRSRGAPTGGIFVAIGTKFVRYEPQPAS